MRRRAWKVKSLASVVRRQLPWLETSDRATLRAWCEHEIIGSAVFMKLMDDGIADSDGKLREILLNTWRTIRAAQLRYSNALGMSPAARTAIKVNGTSAALDLALAAQSREPESPDTELSEPKSPVPDGAPQ
jgi:hypothetical protein